MFFFLIFYILISITLSFTDAYRALGPNDGLRSPGAAGKRNGAGDKQQGGSRLVTVASRAQGVFFFGYSLLLCIPHIRVVLICLEDLILFELFLFA